MSSILNSLTRFVDEHATANRARMLRRELERTGHQRLAAVIVEGNSDQIFYLSLLDNSRSYTVAGYCKETVVKAVRILTTEGFKGVIGIVDDDYDSLNGKPVAYPNVVVTDTHDLETMVLESPALEKFFRFLLPADHLHRCAQFTHDIRAKMLELGMPVGCLRWVSKVENLGLDFKDMRFLGFIDATALVLDVAKMVEYVVAHSPVSRSSKHEILNRLMALAQGGHNPWLVCQGHDLVCILPIVVGQKVKAYCPRSGPEKARFEENLQAETEPRSLEKNLLKCYGQEHFQSTRLFKAMQDWEKGNAPYTVLAASIH